MMALLCSFSFAKKKTNQKKSPLRRDPSGCPVLLESGGRCGTRWRSDSHSAYSPASAMLGASPRGRLKPQGLSAPFEGISANLIMVPFAKFSTQFFRLHRSLARTLSQIHRYCRPKLYTSLKTKRWINCSSEKMAHQ